jgi:hypothetical protein
MSTKLVCDIIFSHRRICMFRFHIVPHSFPTRVRRHQSQSINIELLHTTIWILIDHIHIEYNFDCQVFNYSTSIDQYVRALDYQPLHCSGIIAFS